MQWCISGLENRAVLRDEGSIPLASSFSTSLEMTKYDFVRNDKV